MSRTFNIIGGLIIIITLFVACGGDKAEDVLQTDPVVVDLREILDLRDSNEVAADH